MTYYLKKEIRAGLYRRSLYQDKLPGGLADESLPQDFDPLQLMKGIKVEMEHTNDPKLAREIAMDHLKEDEKYYDKLELIEPHHKEQNE